MPYMRLYCVLKTEGESHTLFEWVWTADIRVMTWWCLPQCKDLLSRCILYEHAISMKLNKKTLLSWEVFWIDIKLWDMWCVRQYSTLRQTVRLKWRTKTCNRSSRTRMKSKKQLILVNNITSITGQMGGSFCVHQLGNYQQPLQMVRIKRWCIWLEACHEV